ncbi:16635_t:CDS:2, partial [Racocetra fulgida]
MFYIFNLVTYLVVDCGGGTVDLTVRRLLPGGRIAETTERTGDFCGGTYVDDEFIKFLEEKAGKSAVKMLKEKHYDQINYMVHKYFCPEIKIPFSGRKDGFKTIEFDIEKKCPALIQYITGSERDNLEDDEWLIDLDFDTVKSFFDPVIRKVLRLIALQLSKCPDCSVLFLVGGFGESRYLQHRIKEEFGNQDSNGRIDKFYLLASKGTEVDVEKEFSDSVAPVFPDQTAIFVQFFYTTEYNATYCDEPHMRKLGSFRVDGIPTESSGNNRSVLISL